MAWTSRQRWTLYGLAGLLTAAAMWAVDQEQGAGPGAETVAPVAPVARPLRAATPAPEAAAELALVPLSERPFGGAGRSPFGASQALAPSATAAAAAAAAAAQAASPAPALPAPVAASAAPGLPFTFLGRWTEGGVTTVFLSSGGRPLSAVAGRPLTPDYRVDSIGDRTMQLRHVPSGTTHTLALVAGGPAAAAAAPPAAQADTEESN